MLNPDYRPRDDREWKATLGVDNQMFIRLTSLFERAYIELRKASLDQVIKENPNGHKFHFKTYENLLFFVLFCLKTSMTFDVIAFIFKMDLANAKRNFNTAIDILHYCLDIENLLPKRTFDCPDEFSYYFNGGINTIIFDGMEQLIQRPSDYEIQRLYFSGKKKAHTIKCLIISDLSRYIHYVSQPYIGKKHDFSIVKDEFPPDENWFEGYTILLDLGYQGFWNYYPNAKSEIPIKKKKNKELSLQQKNENKELAKKRIMVEHSIGGMKRYDILSGKCRIHDFRLYDKVLAVCAGLWNFFITN